MEFNIQVDKSLSGKRLDLILKDSTSGMSRATLQNAVREGLCRVDGVEITEPDKKIFSGQTIEISIPDNPTELSPEEGDTDVIWHDEHMAVCFKPVNLTVHPCPSCTQNTLVQRLLARFPQLAKQGGLRPGIVHRLDKDTSGLMIVALDEPARLKLTEEFAERKIGKEYLALVHGIIPEKGECCEAIGRHPVIKTKMAVIPEQKGGKPAKTQWRRLWHGTNISLVAVRIFSGRTHQIRVHMAHIGYPVLGDKLYATPVTRKMAPTQMLHAWQLWFDHPSSGKSLHFCAPPPPQFFKTACQLSFAPIPIVVTGNPGSGKSTFRKILAGCGLPEASADDIVAKLYSQEDVVDWVRKHMGDTALNKKGSLDKKALFTILRDNRPLGLEFERFVHSLVAAEIENFWHKQKGLQSLAAVAEIPLFFECGWQDKFTPRPLTIGVHCDLSTRNARIESSRGWDIIKLHTIEQWQWPEEKKMSACDIVVDNNGTKEKLEKEAKKVIAKLEEIKLKEEHELLAHLKALCSCN